MLIGSIVRKSTAALWLLTAPVLGGASPSTDTSARVALSALQSICLGDDTRPAAVLGRADAAGWRKDKPVDVEDWDLARDRSLQIGGTVLILDVWSIDTKLVREDSCSIGARAQTTGWRDAAQQWLGLAPSLVLGPTATFFAIRSDDGWRAATAQDRSNDTISQSRHYNFVVSDGIWRGEDRPSAILMVDHFRAADPAT